MAEEILREILLKLPTWDVGRCRCVSRRWHGILTDSSFVGRHVHADHVVSGSSCAGTLVVMEIRGHGIGLEMVVLNASSAKPMCHFTDLSAGYRHAGTCNGFLFLQPNVSGWPLFVCNPITGEKMKIPSAPTQMTTTYFHTYAMGFSPYTHQYKLFRRLSSDDPEWWQGPLSSYLDVYTLGDNIGSWRRHQHRLQNQAVHNFDSPPPVALVDGKLYVLMEQSTNYGVPYKMLVIDIASEAYSTCRLPEEFIGVVKAEVQPFEMCGQLCVAVRFLCHHVLHFWIMRPPLQGLEEDDGMLHGSWELRYTFYVDDADRCSRLRGAWLDGGDGMLCYRLGDILYKYDTTKDEDEDDERKKKKKQVGDSSEWDHRIQLPVAPSSDFKRWNVYGGYRPSLLSPHHFSIVRKDDKQQDFEQTLVHALRCKQSSKQRCSLDRDNHPVHAANRVR